MRKKRYLEKLEVFEGEKEFIKSHTIEDDVTKRALLYALQVCVDVIMDVHGCGCDDNEGHRSCS